jgi:hypothetical protein
MYLPTNNAFTSVTDPDPGSFAFSTPGSGMVFFFRIADLGELSDNFFGKKYYA